ncbi:hypothetical protein ARMGADRAFT_1085336 [Armillaria gallica]|uniref:Uncharacterized protein n=1 Tax=Armillaria gallica TaxID=47427 RepID=A0A2H3D9X8_ARMGA|nr:hypothetical protein ARMGADRAFT_1085336 [Armillaria gallica]
MDVAAQLLLVPFWHLLVSSFSLNIQERTFVINPVAEESRITSVAPPHVAEGLWAGHVATLLHEAWSSDKVEGVHKAQGFSPRLVLNDGMSSKALLGRYPLRRRSVSTLSKIYECRHMVYSALNVEPRDLPLTPSMESFPWLMNIVLPQCIGVQSASGERDVMVRTLYCRHERLLRQFNDRVVDWVDARLDAVKSRQEEEVDEEEKEKERGQKSAAAPTKVKIPPLPTPNSPWPRAQWPSLQPSTPSPPPPAPPSTLQQTQCSTNRTKPTSSSNSKGGGDSPTISPLPLLTSGYPFHLVSEDTLSVPPFPVPDVIGVKR